MDNFVIGANGGHWRQWAPFKWRHWRYNSDSGAQWRWRQWDMLSANGAITIGGHWCKRWRHWRHPIGANDWHQWPPFKWRYWRQPLAPMAPTDNFASGANGGDWRHWRHRLRKLPPIAPFKWRHWRQPISLAPTSLCATVTIANGAIGGNRCHLNGAHWRQWRPLAPMKSCPLVSLALIILQSCSIVLPNKDYFTENMDYEKIGQKGLITLKKITAN